MKPLLLAAVAAYSFAFCVSDAHAAVKWTTHRTGKPAFSIQTPKGWVVTSNGRQILAQSADRSQKVLVEGFTGASAKARITQTAKSRADLFPGAKLGKVVRQGTQGDAAVATLTFTNRGKAAAQATLLASVTEGSGMLYAIAAPKARFAAEKPTLVRIVKSLRFDGAPAKKGSKTAAASRTKYVKWTDPKERAFSFESPVGWKVEGGAHRIASTHVNQSVTLTAPDDSMMIRFNDPSMPLLQEPNLDAMQMYGVGEGVPTSPNGTYVIMFLRFMPAAQFNPWYAQQILGPALDNLQILKTTELPAEARKMQQSLQKYAGDTATVEVTSAFTEFKGIDKETNKPVTGVVASTIQHVLFPGGMNAWGPVTLVISGCTDGQGVTARQARLKEVIQHINKTWREDPKWTVAERQRAAAGTAQVAAASRAATESAIAQSKARAASASSARDDLMSSYWKRVGADDELQRQRINVIRGETDLTNGSNSFKAESGYSSYYYNARTNTVVGTNAANGPGIDFSVLSQY